MGRAVLQTRARSSSRARLRVPDTAAAPSRPSGVSLLPGSFLSPRKVPGAGQAFLLHNNQNLWGAVYRAPGTEGDRGIFLYPG